MAALQATGGDWEAAGHPHGPWWETLGTLGPWALLALLAALFARAFLHRHRYRALDVLSPAGQEEVHEALRAAERRTVGEILPVVVERSDPHPAAEWLAALAFLLFGSALLLPHLPWDLPALLLASQLGFGLLGFGTARAVPGFKRLFVFEDRATAVAEEQAFQEFYGEGLHKTEAATGVLLFVSLLERRVVVLADEGIAAQVGPEAWLAVDQAVLDGIRRGSLKEGLTAGIRAAGELLAEHFPWREGDRNEVPDRLVIRRE